MDFSKIPLFQGLTSKMGWLSHRQQVLARNVANVNTPGYRPKDLTKPDFEEVMRESVGGGRTTPVSLVVRPQARLRFKNTDPFKHRLYVVGSKTFVAGDTVKGGTRDWTVPAPGSYEVRDELAPSLRMWIVAENDVAEIAYPNLKGEFALRLEEDGEYSIQAYFAGKKVGDPRPITITNGRDVNIAHQPIKLAPNPEKSKKK